MQHTHTLLLLTLMGWLTSAGASVLAQDTTPPRRLPVPEATALNPSVRPTPRFLQVEVDIGAGGLGPIRLHYDPVWVALHRPQVRVGQAPTEPPPEADIAPLLEGRADQLHHALGQALDRVQPPAAPLP